MKRMKEKKVLKVHHLQLLLLLLLEIHLLEPLDMRSPLNLCIKSLKLAFSSLEFFSGEHPMLAIPVKPSKQNSLIP
jgi:hypothetical protein